MRDISKTGVTGLVTTDVLERLPFFWMFCILFFLPFMASAKRSPSSCTTSFVLNVNVRVTRRGGHRLERGIACIVAAVDSENKSIFG